LKTTSDGSARGALDTVAIRMLALLRVAGMVSAIVFVGLWWSWYGATAMRLAGPIAVLVWGVVLVAVFSQGRAPPWCIAGDAVLGVVLALGAPHWLPPQVVGESSTWLFLKVLGAATIAAWCIRSAWWVVVPAAGSLAFAAGAGVFSRRLAVAVCVLVAASVLFRVANRQLRRSAGNADAWMGAIRDGQRLAAVAAARSRDQRKQERIIHDTVLNTLTGIGWGGGDDVEETRARCGRSMTAVRQLLAEDDDPEGNPPAVGMAQRLEDRVEDVVTAANGTGLDVTLTTGPGDPPPADAVPAEVVDALAGAIGEVLANVRRHAGTTRADVTVSRDTWGGVRIEACDEGVGFDPERCPPDRLGLRESVVGRVADVGGSATIRSAPGRGTTVVLSWHAGSPPAARMGSPTPPATTEETAAGAATAGTANFPGTADQATTTPALGTPGITTPGIVPRVAWDPSTQSIASRVRAPQISHPRHRSAMPWDPGSRSGGSPGDPASRVARDPASRVVARDPAVARIEEDYAAGLRRAVCTVAAVWQVLLVAPLVASWHRYHAPELALAMWVVLAAAVVPAVRTLRIRVLHRREAVLVVLTAVAGAVAVGLDTKGADVARAVNWFGVDAVPLLLALVVTSRPAREWVPAAVLTDAVVLWIGVARAGTEPLALSRLLAASVALWSLLVMVASVGPALRSTAEATARAVAAETALAARRDSATAISRDRRRRQRFLQQETMPLLHAIATGHVDPRAPEVRDACAAQATAVRRRLATSEQPGRLGELEDLVEAAETRGVAVEVQIAGDIARTPAPVRIEITAVLDEMLNAAPAGPALLTLLCSASGGSMYISFPAVQPMVAPRPATRIRTWLTTVHSEVEDGHACLEAHW
jgi:signal transduction histidine kinase